MRSRIFVYLSKKLQKRKESLPSFSGRIRGEYARAQNMNLQTDEEIYNEQYIFSRSIK